ncbi:diaminopimelate epimerase [Arenimonas sp. GDDSR-1]|uniref:diaminopimelate epimerase n=1 Tax=Arenimonas sp. GDDSR-1 TaxID=2950125 RepID=UPI002617F978|nr:diaminopimelate epimerase [Arenimonas sp. GDDSR-1]
MHGAGNDFVVIDCRDGAALPDAEGIRRMGDRHFGIGFDQLLTVEAPETPGAVASYRILNQDGSFAGQCGNGARCVAHWLVRSGVTDVPAFELDSPAGVIRVRRIGNDYALGMGHPRFAPAQIPLLAEAEALQYFLPLDGVTHAFSAVSMGNPHAVFRVDSVVDAPVERWGKAVQAAQVFPEGVNVGFAEVLDRGNIRLRVYERGVGETLACGSGACAAAVSLMRQNLVARTLAVHLPGGTLMIDWPDDAAAVTMTGPAVWVYDGEWRDD